MSAHEATLSVPFEGREVTLVRASRQDKALLLTESEPGLRDKRGMGDAYWSAEGTLALALALHGWPLVRSADQWERCHHADGGPPEALAHKIQIWEAWNRKHGWCVDAPRIAGLSYPTWADFEVEWAAAREAFEATLVTSE